jgi:hypothetical protein
VIRKTIRRFNGKMGVHTAARSEIARVLMRLNHVASFIEYTDDSIMRTAVKLCVADCIGDCVWLAIPKPTEWQRIGD